MCNLSTEEAMQISRKWLRQMAQPFSNDKIRQRQREITVNQRGRTYNPAQVIIPTSTPGLHTLRTTMVSCLAFIECRKSLVSSSNFQVNSLSIYVLLCMGSELEKKIKQGLLQQLFSVLDQLNCCRVFFFKKGSAIAVIFFPGLRGD